MNTKLESPEPPGAASDPTIGLVRRWRSGDTSAFEALVHRYSGPLLSYVFSIVRQMQDGEDVVQDTFFRAFRSVKQLRDEGSVWLWFKQIAHNLAIDCVKRSVRQGVTADPDTIEKLDTRRDEMKHSILPEILQSIEALPETYRKTAIYFYLEEWPYSQIAETLGIEPATVRQRISRINRLLRESLGRKRS